MFYDRAVYDFVCSLTFHSHGIEPWLLSSLRKFKPNTVLFLMLIVVLVSRACFKELFGCF